MPDEWQKKTGQQAAWSGAGYGERKKSVNISEKKEQDLK